MISEHPSGLKVIAAPSRPAEMRSFDFEVVTRLLDLVAAHFDNVVIDVPRTWFAWTDSVLIGSNRLFLVTEMTVPGLKHARHLVNVIRERLPDGPKLEVIVNRFEQRLFGPGLRRADIEQALGESLINLIPRSFPSPGGAGSLRRLCFRKVEEDRRSPATTGCCTTAPRK